MKDRCCCPDYREVNAHRPNGIPMVIWTCPTHGNLYEDVPSGITLTSFQAEIMNLIGRNAKEGRFLSADDVSKMTNHTLRRVEQAMAVLKSIGFIEQNKSQNRTSHQQRGRDDD